MKKILFLVVLIMATSMGLNAQNEAVEKVRVYAELLGSGTNFLGLNKNVKVSVDMGQPQSTWKSYKLKDESGKDIKFNSMVAAMNYMGQRGWKFIQTYVVTEKNQNIYHWLMYKDISSDSEILDGLNIGNFED